MKQSIIFWLDAPPVCCKGLFDAVAEQWNGEACYVIAGEISEDRAVLVDSTCDCVESENRRIKYVFFHEMKDATARYTFLESYKDDIHVFNGYMSRSAVYLKKLLKINKNAKVIVWAERPCVDLQYRGKMKKLFRFLHTCRHSLYALRYRRRVTALCALGDKGVEAYQKLGWPAEKVFPLLYLPDVKMVSYDTPVNKTKDSMVRFVYLGRFSAGWKGTDLLIDACKHLKNQNYSLEMVGGYGDYKEKTMQYISQNDHLSFGGTWKIHEACERLHNFDVCIVPSRFEGWNVTVNEALMAGIGCIVTDEAVSDELVRESGAGLIIKPDAQSIANAMDMVMDDPECINSFKRNACAYRDRISANVCAQYFIDVTNFLFDEDGGKVKPVAPWMEEKNNGKCGKNT